MILYINVKSHVILITGLDSATGTIVSYCIEAGSGQGALNMAHIEETRGIQRKWLDDL